jgi:hypothetical protein
MISVRHPPRRVAANRGSRRTSAMDKKAKTPKKPKTAKPKDKKPA